MFNVQTHNFKRPAWTLGGARVITPSPQNTLLTHTHRYWRYSHGTTWAELADDVTVVDVPGDHFSLLRQDAPDMEPLVRATGVVA